MADISACWVRTAHEPHGWTEVDGKVVSLVDASTVLQVPEGSVVHYHHCNGVPDVSEPGGMRLRGLDYQRDYETIVEVRSHLHGGIRVVRERRVTLDAVYERTVREDAEWTEVQRITCFCCSCEDGNDWACRNHNMGWGMRPCELHGVEGQREVNPETDEEGEMPESVQEIRRQRDEKAVYDLGG